MFRCTVSFTEKDMSGVQTTKPGNGDLHVQSQHLGDWEKWTAKIPKVVLTICELQASPELLIKFCLGLGGSCIRREWGMGEKRKLREEMQGGTTNTKGYLRGIMENYYYGSILNHIHIWNKFKWSHQIIEETIPQVDIFCHQMKYWVPRIVIPNEAVPKESHGNLQTTEAIGSLHKLSVRPLFWRQPLHMSMNAQKLSWCRSRTSIPTGKCSRHWKALNIYHRRKGSHQPSFKPCDLQYWPACTVQ